MKSGREKDANRAYLIFNVSDLNALQLGQREREKESIKKMVLSCLATNSIPCSLAVSRLICPCKYYKKERFCGETRSRDDRLTMSRWRMRGV